MISFMNIDLEKSTLILHLYHILGKVLILFYC